MTKNLFSRKWFLVVLQVVAWLLLFSLPFLLKPNQSPPPGKPEPSGGISLFYAVNNLFWILFFYLNALVLILKILYRKKFPAYVLAQVLCFIAMVAISWMNTLWLRDGAHFNLRAHFLITFFFFIFMLATSTAIRMGIDRIRAEKLADERENENLKTELTLLRSQVSPHFMFNVLNNMVALARKKSDLLEPSLIKLSSLMRYMLYDVEGEKVSLEKEIEYLENYIDLQKQRISKSIHINTDFTDVDRNYEIEPMLLIPFVENAFKHGTGLVENAGIDMVLRAKNNVLQFDVRNRYRELEFEIKDKTSGIGLANVKRRLNLLYGKRHNLKVEKLDGWFNISLTITLS